MFDLDLEVYNGEPTDDAGVFWWCSLSPYRLNVWDSSQPRIYKRVAGSEQLSLVNLRASGWFEVEIFPAYVEHLRALALRLTFDGFELQAEYEWPEGWKCDGPI